MTGGTYQPQRGLGGDVWNSAYRELRNNQIVNASEMIAVADRSDGTPWSWPWEYNIDPTNPPEYPGTCHSGGANVLFADGHVWWYVQKDLLTDGTFSPRDQSIRRMWNNDNQP